MVRDHSQKPQGGNRPKITWNHVIRKKTEKLKIAGRRNMRCSSSGCKGMIAFECAYTYRGEDGRVIRACFLYCEAHTRRFAFEHGLELSAAYLKENSGPDTAPADSFEAERPGSDSSHESNGDTGCIRFTR